QRRVDLARVVFQLLALGALIAASFYIVRPFLVSVAWAVMIVVATWPLLKMLQARMGGSHALAAPTMTLAVLRVFSVPLSLLVMTAVATARHLGEWSHWLATASIPPPPPWVGTIPAVGQTLAERWLAVSAASSEQVSTLLLPYARGAGLMLVGHV